MQVNAAVWGTKYSTRVIWEAGDSTIDISET